MALLGNLLRILEKMISVCNDSMKMLRKCKRFFCNEMSLQDYNVMQCCLAEKHIHKHCMVYTCTLIMLFIFTSGSRSVSKIVQTLLVM